MQSASMPKEKKPKQTIEEVASLYLDKVDADRVAQTELRRAIGLANRSETEVRNAGEKFVAILNYQADISGCKPRYALVVGQGIYRIAGDKQELFQRP